MFSIFKKKAPNNLALNLFKITNMEYATGFDTVGFLLLLKEELLKLTGEEPTDYFANSRSNGWKTWKGFERNVNKIKTFFFFI